MSIIHASLAALALWRLDCGAIQEPDLNIYSDTIRSWCWICQATRLATTACSSNWRGRVTSCYRPIV